LIAWVSSIFHLGWLSAFLLATGMFTVLAVYAYLAADAFLAHLLLFGIIAGIVELAADCWLVLHTGTLVYPAQEPMIACSPLYMPFAWAVVLVQVGYLGWLISSKESLAETVIITFFIGVLFIPVFEHFASGAGWWYYRDVGMLGKTPYYIIIGEGMICATLPVLFRIQAHRRAAVAAVFGVAQGLWIWAAYVISFNLFE
jgi:hypothetical protein